MIHTDIQSDSLFIRYLPAFLKPYALLARLDRPVGIWLLLLPGWWAIVLGAGGALRMNRADWIVMALFGAGAVVMRAAGCVVNDLWDRKLDRAVARTANRPLASGAVAPWQAVIFLILLLLSGLLVLIQLSPVAILLGILSLPLVALYPLAKRVTWWPQLVLGLVFNFGALMGWASVTAAVGMPALLLYGGGILWTLAYDTVYAHQDIEDDERIGIRSTARKFGRYSKLMVALFFAGAFALIAFAFLDARAWWPALAALALPAWHIRWQLQNWEPWDQEGSLAIFRANRDFGLLILLAAILS